ncbi:hypothetical protein Tco_1046706, partial [Tanacetum coccineum]
HLSDITHNEDGNPARANIKQAHGRFYTSAGNPIKEILLKLNLPDHRIFKDGGEDICVEEESMRKMVMMRKMKVIEDLNNEKDERKWQSMVLEMKIEEIMCSKREIPARV